MSIEERLDKTARVFTLLFDIAKLAGLTTLILVGVAAIAFPSQVQGRLRALGLKIQQVDVLGVKLVQNETFDIANSLVDTKMSVDSAAVRLAAASGMSTEDRKAAEVAIAGARNSVLKIQDSLGKQESAIKDAKARSGVTSPALPSTGWIFVGRIAENGTYIAAPRIDAKATAISNGVVTSLMLKYDSPVAENGDDCVRTDLKDVQPPSPNSVQMLLQADPPAQLTVLSTAGCRSVDGGKWLYANIKIPADRVRFAKFSDWK